MIRHNEPRKEATLSLVPAAIESLSQISPAGQFDIGLVGDVYVRDDYLAAFGIHNLGELRSMLWQPLAEASLIIANLEAPITSEESPLEDKPYLHKTSNAVLEIFDPRFVLSLANNHIMDFGTAGLVDTLSALDAAGIPYAGAGLNLEQASAPCWLTVNGVKVAVICAADPRFHPATENTPGTCPARRDHMVKAVRTAADEGAVIVVSLHMGLEHVSVPSLSQIDLAKACLEAGAHIVHFHHSHCLSGAVTDGRGAVLFGTGNYIYTIKTKLSSSRRTASWRARVDASSRKVVAITACPALLDSSGLPRPLEGRAKDRELRRLQARGQNVLGGSRRQWARLQDMLKPGFVRINTYNYASILRKRGLPHLLKSVLSGIKAQFGGQGR